MAGVQMDVDIDVDVDVETPPPRENNLLQLSLDHLYVRLGNKKTQTTILHDVNANFGPAELIAIMGPSGSGKTTLLAALTAQLPPQNVSGRVTINGKPASAQLMRRYAALVPQDDLLTPVLTPHEALMEAATLKTSLSPAAAARRTAELLAQFGLTECRHVAIGHPEGAKGLSGGQKKRLSVALELIGGPSLLLLDEPTSGLDAVSAAALVKDLKAVAATGVTVIATIHQPSASTFLHFDRLLLLAAGKTCYAGPVSKTQPMAFFKTAGHTCPPLHNPADFCMEVLASAPNVVDELAPVASAMAEWAPLRPDLPALSLSGPAYASSLGTQFQVLFRRNMRINMREPALIKARFASHLLIGLVIGGIYFDLAKNAESVNDRVALTLFSMIFLMLSATLPTVIAVLPELAVTKKESRNNYYALQAYYAAKVLTDTPLLVIPPALYLATMGPMSGLVDSGWRFGMLYLACMIQVFVAHAWAMVISCAAPNLAVAVFLAPLSIMPMMLFSGFFKNVEHITWVFRWISYISHETYCWNVFQISAFWDLELDPPLSGNEVLRSRLAIDPGAERFALSFGIVVGFTILWRVVALFALRWRMSVR